MNDANCSAMAPSKFSSPASSHQSPSEFSSPASPIIRFMGVLMSAHPSYASWPQYGAPPKAPLGAPLGASS
eukprot:7754940-Pyramimonas_sp.AAC.1